MERIIVKYLLNFFLENNVIASTQHGFLPHKSTVTCLLQCVNQWSLRLDEDSPVDIVYLDFAKAFDRVPHNRLFYKLEYIRIRGRLLEWIVAFLTARTFSVRIGSCVSTERSVCSGVPQGSVLGPALFLSYIADLSFQITSDHIFYADDCKIYANPLTDHNSLQLDLHSVKKWCQNWLIPLNLDKCVLMHLGTNNPLLTLNIANQQLKVVKYHSDLGITITPSLSWSQHIGEIVKRANRSIFLFSKAFRNLDFQSFCYLFKSYIRPLLEHAAVIWSPMLIRDNKLIETVQRRATRIMLPSIRNYSYQERLKLLHLPTLNQRRLRGDLIFAYKALNGFFDQKTQHLFVLNQDNRLRGHPLKLAKERFRTKQRQFFFTNRIFDSWNSLPLEVISAPSINSFKNRLDSIHEVGLDTV